MLFCHASPRHHTMRKYFPPTCVCVCARVLFAPFNLPAGAQTKMAIPPFRAANARVRRRFLVSPVSLPRAIISSQTVAHTHTHTLTHDHKDHPVIPYVLPESAAQGQDGLEPHNMPVFMYGFILRFSPFALRCSGHATTPRTHRKREGALGMAGYVCVYMCVWVCVSHTDRKIYVRFNKL